MDYKFLFTAFFLMLVLLKYIMTMIVLQCGKWTIEYDGSKTKGVVSKKLKFHILKLTSDFFIQIFYIRYQYKI